MATSFTTTINISAEDLQLLKDQGYSLYGFKSVASSGNGFPTVCLHLPSEKLLPKTTISWNEEMRAYNSLTSISPGVKINPNGIVPTDLGQKVTIERGTGQLYSSRNGYKGVVSFDNEDTREFTVGINQSVNGEYNMLCALSIFVGYSVPITPLSKVALMFSQERIPTGTVIAKAMSDGAFIDATGVSSREVNYVQNRWSANGVTWFKNLNASTDLRNLLIERL